MATKTIEIESEWTLVAIGRVANEVITVPSGGAFYFTVTPDRHRPTRDYSASPYHSGAADFALTIQGGEYLWLATRASDLITTLSSSFSESAVPSGLRVVDGTLYLDLSDGSSLSVGLPSGGPDPSPTPVAPTFTTPPSLTGSTALGSTITVSLGAATGTPAPTITGTLNRPGKSPAAVQNGATFEIEAADQGGTVTLTATATNGVAPDAIEAVSLSVPPAAQHATDLYPDAYDYFSDLSLPPEGGKLPNMVDTGLEADVLNSPELLTLNGRPALRCTAASEQGLRGTFPAARTAVTIGGRVEYRGPLSDGATFHRIAVLGRPATSSTNTAGTTSFIYRGSTNTLQIFRGGNIQYSRALITGPFDWAMQYSTTVLRFFLNGEMVYDGAAGSPADITAWAVGRDNNEGVIYASDVDIYGVFVADSLLTLEEMKAAWADMGGAPVQPPAGDGSSATILGYRQAVSDGAQMSFVRGGITSAEDIA